MNLNDYALECHEASIAWWQDPITKEPIQRNFGELIALCHSELSEALEGYASCHVHLRQRPEVRHRNGEGLQ